MRSASLELFVPDGARGWVPVPEGSRSIAVAELTFLEPEEDLGVWVPVERR